jgi:hypothetical protein
MTTPTNAQIKGLFFHLIKSVGGVEAAGAYLSISHQRVSQLQSINCADMPTLMQIVTLEHAVGVPVVTRALAESVVNSQDANDLLAEACEATEAAAELQRLARAKAEPRVIRAAAIRLEQEARDAVAAAVKPAA